VCWQKSTLATTRRSPIPASLKKNKEEEPNKKLMWIVVGDGRLPSAPSLGGARKEEKIRRTRRRKENMLWTLDMVGYCASYSLVGGCVRLCVPKIFFLVSQGATLISP